MTLLRGLSLLLTTIVLAACGGGGGGGSPGSGTLSVKMTDAPATPDYAEVWVTVEKVRVHQSDTAADGQSGWEEIVLDPPRKIELLDLRNGVLAELGQVEVPAGTYHQFRLVLGDGPTDNELVLAADPATRVPLTTPSAQQSGLKLNAKPFEVADGQTVELVLDFDAARSVVRAGNSGKYLLKPVITVIPMLDAGALAGSFADPAASEGASVSLQAYDATTGSASVLRATTPAADGSWKLAPVEAGGDYALVVVKPGFRSMVFTDVAVATAQTLVVDAISLVPVAVDTSTEPATTPTMRVAAGHVAPAQAALVRTLQRVIDAAGTADDLVVETAFMNADADTGAFAFDLTVEPALVGPLGEAMVDGDNAGIHTFTASGNSGSGAIADVDLNTGDVTNLVITLEP